MRAKHKTIIQVEDPKFRQLLAPYQEYHSPGPYFRKERVHGRMYINLLKGYKTGINGILYARYLLEVKLGRRLKDDCEVDHIDGFPWNDSLSNLQELPARENSAKGRSDLLNKIQYAKTHISIKCPVCGNWFDRLKTCRNGVLTFCSRQCNGKFAHFVGDRSQICQETKEIEAPSGIDIPAPFYEPFEKFSTPRMHRKTLYLCECGKPLPNNNMQYCSDCREKLMHRIDYNNDASRVESAKNEIIAAILEEYDEHGKIVMYNFCKRFNLTDKSLAKRISILFGKSYKELIAELCNK